MRPYYAEGSKTLAFEIAEQLGWELPDRVVAPIASGSLFTKVARGFQEFIDAGPARAASCRSSTAPRRSAARRWRRRSRPGTDVCRPVKPDTIAKSLAIGNPADGPYAVELARATGGAIDSVTDDEIRAGIRLLAETTGIFTETAGGVTTAVLAKLAERGDIGPDERVVLLHHRRRPEDARHRARHVRGDRDRAVARRVRRGVRAGGGRRPDGGHGQDPHPAARRRRRRRRGRGRGRARSARCSSRCTPSTASCASGIADDDGGLRRFVNVYLGGEDIRFLDGLETPVADGDELTILPAVAGG